LSAAPRLAGIRAVFFDAVGTLIVPDPPAAAVYHAVAGRHGSRLDMGVVRARFAAAFRRQEELDREGGWRTDEARELARWRAIVAEVLDDISDPERCFHTLYRYFAEPGSWSCDPKAGPVLRELARRGFRLGIASNFDHRLRGLAAALPELAPAGRLVISAEAGWRKPAPGFFARLCREADLPPGQILYVGDDEANDYAGATAAGLRALLFDPRGGSAVAAGGRIGSLGALPGLLA
jgi:putative hydrolase of the HAD superfamily